MEDYYKFIKELVLESAAVERPFKVLAEIKEKKGFSTYKKFKVAYKTKLGNISFEESPEIDHEDTETIDDLIEDTLDDIKKELDKQPYKVQSEVVGNKTLQVQDLDLNVITGQISDILDIAPYKVLKYLNKNKDEIFCRSDDTYSKSSIYKIGKHFGKSNNEIKSGIKKFYSEVYLGK